MGALKPADKSAQGEGFLKKISDGVEKNEKREREEKIFGFLSQQDVMCDGCRPPTQRQRRRWRQAVHLSTLASLSLKGRVLLEINATPGVEVCVCSALEMIAAVLFMAPLHEHV